MTIPTTTPRAILEQHVAGVYISGVAGYGIIEASSRGCVRAADWLFP